LRISRHTEKNIKIFSTIIENLHSIQEIESYRLYLIANTYLNHKRGSFTIEEFTNLLINKFNQKSLKNTSNLNKFKKQLYQKLIQSSIFFIHINENTFQFISYRKILNNFNISKVEDNYWHFPLENVKNNFYALQKKTFLDLIIGSFLLFHKEISNQQVADQFKITVMRVQQATRRNNEVDVIKKTTRLVETQCEDKKDAIEKQKKLWNVGICSKVKSKGKKYFIYCYRTNAYNSELPSHKGRVRQSAEKLIIKKYSKIIDNKCTFLSLTNRKLNLNLSNQKNSNVINYRFNEKHDTWSLDKYIQNYGKFNF
jgi:hypothetical protein